ncbi:CPAS1-like protein [Mya arenaria]|uniref:CPAS1-like protein n=1 Tax=Mya arenaria TaxID=6604 RepID=A0ABY7EKX5_MYAAR|nr:CPAS1-like protein [Mya arenaria]
MDFGSDYVYCYDEPDFEYIYDEEYEAGMNVSDSDSDDEGADPVPSVLGDPAPFTSSPLPPLMVGMGPQVPPPPPPPAAVGFSSSLRSVPPAPAPPVVPQRAMKFGRGHWRTNTKSNASTASGSQPRPGRRVRQADTNIVSVKFDKLITPSNMHAGDPQACDGCGAILSHMSKLLTRGEEKVWECEFCGRDYPVDVEEGEVPTTGDVTYMLEPGLATTASGPAGLDQAFVVFCVDVSGSMCVTTEVPGHIELRGAESLRQARLMNRERADQYLPRQSRNVTYVSRLQSVQAAIDHQLNEMARDFPNRRVALVTFSNEVTVYGDGKCEPVSIVGDKLTRRETLTEISQETPFPDNVKNSRQQLSKKLFELEEGGPTALGPALLVATTMAGRVRGSKVILCTDGLANIGMGKLDNVNTDAEVEQAAQFYDDVSDTAVQNGVSISVITIKGTDCRLVELGKMADKTGGQVTYMYFINILRITSGLINIEKCVNIVDPLKLTQEFSSILANKVIATNVTATMIIHKELFFFYDETEESKVVRNIGNVTASTEITFEYGMRTKPQEEQMEVEAQGAPIGAEEQTEGAEPMKEEDNTTSEAPKGAEGPPEVDDNKELPFQLQIVYTDTEGAKALRVITKTKPVTRDRKKAERLAKLDVLAAHTAQTSAQMAQDGKYTLSRERALMNQRVAWRHTRDDDGRVVQSHTKYKKAFGKIKSMENYLAGRQRSERSTHGRTYSDEEEDEPDMEMNAAPKAKSKSFFSRLRKKRSETTEDHGAAIIYKGKSAKSFFTDSD